MRSLKKTNDIQIKKCLVNVEFDIFILLRLFICHLNYQILNSKQ